MTDFAMSGQERREAHERLLRAQLEVLPESRHVEYLAASLANARSVLDELRDERDRLAGQREGEVHGPDDARRSASYRAEIVRLRALLTQHGVSE